MHNLPWSGVDFRNSLTLLYIKERNDFMLKELHVVTFTITQENFYIEEVTPALFSFGTLIKAERSSIALGESKANVADKCSDSIVGDFLTVFEMSNGEIIYIAEDYDWIRRHCSD